MILEHLARKTKIHRDEMSRLSLENNAEARIVGEIGLRRRGFPVGSSKIARLTMGDRFPNRREPVDYPVSIDLSDLKLGRAAGNMLTAAGLMVKYPDSDFETYFGLGTSEDVSPYFTSNAPEIRAMAGTILNHLGDAIYTIGLGYTPDIPGFPTGWPQAPANASGD